MCLVSEGGIQSDEDDRIRDSHPNDFLIWFRKDQLIQSNFQSNQVIKVKTIVRIEVSLIQRANPGITSHEFHESRISRITIRSHQIQRSTRDPMNPYCRGEPTESRSGTTERTIMQFCFLRLLPLLLGKIFCDHSWLCPK